MRTEEELRAFYQKILLPLLSSLEKNRVLLMKKNRLFTAIAGILGFVAFYYLLPYAGYFSRGPIFLFFAYAAIPTVIFRTLRKKYRISFKQQIIKKLVHFVNPKLSYYPDQIINRKKVTNSELFPAALKEYRGDDLIRGMIGQTNIEFSEIHLRFAGSSDSLTFPSKYEHNGFFDGLFVSADFNKNFSGKTFVIPKLKKIENILKKKISEFDPTIEYIELDNPSFNNIFTVFSSNQIEARYILSTSMMERLCHFKENVKSDISISFVDSRVNLAISINKPLLEPKYDRTSLSFETIKEYFNDLQLAVGIVENLDLNTRIWTKE